MRAFWSLLLVGLIGSAATVPLWASDEVYLEACNSLLGYKRILFSFEQPGTLSLDTDTKVFINNPHKIALTVCGTESGDEYIPIEMKVGEFCEIKKGVLLGLTVTGYESDTAGQCPTKYMQFLSQMHYGRLSVEAIGGSYTSNYIYANDNTTANPSTERGKLFNDHKAWFGLTLQQTFNGMNPNTIGLDIVFKDVQYASEDPQNGNGDGGKDMVEIQNASAFYGEIFWRNYFKIWAGESVAPYIKVGGGGAMIADTAIKDNFSTNWYVGIGLLGYSGIFAGSFAEIAIRNDELYPHEERLWLRGRLLLAGKEGEDILGYFAQGEAFAGQGADEVRILLGVRVDVSTLSRKIYLAP